MSEGPHSMSDSAERLVPNSVARKWLEFARLLLYFSSYMTNSTSAQRSGVHTDIRMYVNPSNQSISFYSLTRTLKPRTLLPCPLINVLGPLWVLGTHNRISWSAVIIPSVTVQLFRRPFKFLQGINGDLATEAVNVVGVSFSNPMASLHTVTTAIQVHSIRCNPSGVSCHSSSSIPVTLCSPWLPSLDWLFALHDLQPTQWSRLNGALRSLLNM